MKRCKKCGTTNFLMRVGNRTMCIFCAAEKKKRESRL